MSVNNLSFLTTVLAIICVVGASLYGTVRLLRAEKALAAICVLALIPFWFFVQFMLFAAHDKLKSQGIATRAYHFDYAATPLINVLGAALVVGLVAHLVRRAHASSPIQAEIAPRIGERSGIWAWLREPRKLGGLISLALGIAAMSTFFVYVGVMLIIVGVSLLMDVRLWRR